MKAATQKAASRPGPGLGDGVLVGPGWLAGHLNDAELRVVEVDVSPAAYDNWHIDGAVLWNIYTDLKDASYRTVGTAAVERLVARSGIGPDSTVVFYGYAPVLGLWLMKLYGHPDVRILDCSRDTWRAEGHPWSTAASEPPAARYRLGGQDRRLRADRVAVQERHRPAGHDLGGRALGGRVPGGLLLALRRHGARRPRRSRAVGCPPAHRQPLQRRRVVPLRRAVARRLLTGRPGRWA